LKPTKKTLLNPKRQIAVLPWRPAPEEGKIEVLLLTSRETKRWVIPKGWPMKGLAANMAAAREAYEEAGVQGYTAMEPQGSYIYDKRVPQGRPKRVEVVVYPFHVSIEHEEWPEMRERQKLWTSLEDAAEKVDEPQLKVLLRSFDPYHPPPKP
jgi:8-oxo-dGTP pyrophosphatase MutT (NUDIX family)